jgi:hypothetical protein
MLRTVPKTLQRNSRALLRSFELDLKKYRHGLDRLVVGREQGTRKGRVKNSRSVFGVDRGEQLDLSRGGTMNKESNKGCCLC